MSDFIRREAGIETIPDFLVSNVPGFKESIEYLELRSYELDIPGVVCSAFARFLNRLHVDDIHEIGRTSEGILTVAYATLEELVARNETSIQNLVTDEIFENFQYEGPILGRIRSHLRPNSLVLFNRWITKTSE